MMKKSITILTSLFLIINLSMICIASTDTGNVGNSSIIDNITETSGSSTVVDNSTGITDSTAGDSESFYDNSSINDSFHESDESLINTTNITPVEAVPLENYEPQTYHVNAGESIQSVIDNSHDGDIIIVNKGNYNEDITVGNRVLKSNYTQIHGVTITGSSTTVQGFYIKGSGVNFEYPSWDCVIRDNIINTNEESDGIAISENCGNVTIRNNTIYGGYQGISGTNSMQNHILNNLIYNCNIGIASYYTDSDIITGNTIRYCDFGIYYYGNCMSDIVSKNVVKLNNIGIVTKSAGDETISNSQIYNNYFNNSKNVRFDANMQNIKWYTDKTKQTNIVGGTYTAGNYWSGFSEKAVDKNKDGIADKTYTISGNNVDKYPLVHPKGIASFDKDVFKKIYTNNVSDISRENIETTSSSSGEVKIISSNSNTPTSKNVTSTSNSVKCKSGVKITEHTVKTDTGVASMMFKAFGEFISYFGR